MTREDAKKHLELIKAFANGAEIQVNNGSGWVTVTTPAFIGSYRIKPKPIERYAVKWGGSGDIYHVMYESEGQLHDDISNDANYSVIKLLEVEE